MAAGPQAISRELTAILVSRAAGRRAARILVGRRVLATSDDRRAVDAGRIRHGRPSGSGDPTIRAAFLRLRAVSPCALRRTHAPALRCIEFGLRSCGDRCWPSWRSLLLPGCVRRRLLVRSNPPGAMVYVDNQPIGTTPCATSFIYYGTREIRLVKPGYETLTVKQPIPAPWYQIPPLDFASENLAPNEIQDFRTVTYNLTPQVIVPTDQLIAPRRAAARGTQQGAVLPAGAAMAPASTPLLGPPTMAPPAVAPLTGPVLAPPTLAPEARAAGHARADDAGRRRAAAGRAAARAAAGAAVSGQPSVGRRRCGGPLRRG